MITKYDDFLNEGITEVIYHRTYLDPLIRILQTGKILLSASFHGPANAYSKKGYYLSFSRTKNSRLGYLKNAQVVIEFDGKMLGTKYKGGSVNFKWFQKNNSTPTEKNDADEYEERIFSNEPYIENIDKYIKNIDIVMNEELSKKNDHLLDEVKKLKSIHHMIPLLNKIRIFNSYKDLSFGKNWVSIFDYQTVNNNKETFDRDTQSFDMELFKKIITLLLIGDKKVNDEEYVRNFYLTYVNKFKNKVK
jgi:hypothetical protein